MLSTTERRNNIVPFHNPERSPCLSPVSPALHPVLIRLGVALPEQDERYSDPILYGLVAYHRTTSGSLIGQSDRSLADHLSSHGSVLDWESPVLVWPSRVALLLDMMPNVVSMHCDVAGYGNLAKAECDAHTYVFHLDLVISPRHCWRRAAM